MKSAVTAGSLAVAEQSESSIHFRPPTVRYAKHAHMKITQIALRLFFPKTLMPRNMISSLTTRY